MYIHTQMYSIDARETRSKLSMAYTHIEPSCSINNFYHAHMHAFTHIAEFICSCVSNPSSVVDCDACSAVATKSIIKQQDTKITATGNQQQKLRSKNKLFHSLKSRWHQHTHSHMHTHEIRVCVCLCVFPFCIKNYFYIFQLLRMSHKSTQIQL